MVESQTGTSPQILEKVTKELGHLSEREIQRRKELLSIPVVPFEPKVGMKAWEFFEANSQCSNMFSDKSRHLAQDLKTIPSLTVWEFFQKQFRENGPFGQFWEAAVLWSEILSQKRTVFLSAAGAYVPLGGRKAMTALIENNCFDVLVTTSAQLAHDEVETLGGKHSHLTEEISDQLDFELKYLRINRFYKVLGDSMDYYLSDQLVMDLITQLPAKRVMSSREYLYHYGQALLRQQTENGILTTAAEKSLPIYCPALGDGVFGTNILEVWHKTGRRITIDTVILDEMEKMEVVKAAEDFGGRTAAIILAGGVPRNNIQQAQACQYVIGRSGLGHKEAIRFSFTDVAEGGLSGSTISEGVTWDKYATDNQAVEIKTDSNFALDVLSQLMLEFRCQKQRQFQPRFIYNPYGGLSFVSPDGKKRNLHAEFRRNIGK